MLYYRLYFINPENDAIERFADFEAPDDAAALKLAHEHAGEQPLELWCRQRKVERLEPLAGALAPRQDAA